MILSWRGGFVLVSRFCPQTDKKLDELTQQHVKGYSDCNSYFQSKYLLFVPSSFN